MKWHVNSLSKLWGIGGTCSCWYKYSGPQSNTLKPFSFFWALEDEKSEVIEKLAQAMRCIFIEFLVIVWLRKKYPQQTFNNLLESYAWRTPYLCPAFLKRLFCPEQRSTLFLKAEIGTHIKHLKPALSPHYLSSAQLHPAFGCLKRSTALVCLLTGWDAFGLNFLSITTKFISIYSGTTSSNQYASNNSVVAATVTGVIQAQQPTNLAIKYWLTLGGCMR